MIADEELMILIPIVPQETNLTPQVAGGASSAFNKKVTIGKTTEMEFPFNGRRTTLLGMPSDSESSTPVRSGRPSLASVKLEAKFQVILYWFTPLLYVFYHL